MSFIDSRFVVDTDGKNISDKTGDLSALQTTNKGSLVAAINEHTSQLAEKASKTKGIYDFVKDFGGKPDDNTFDNSTALKNALNYLVTNGGGRLLIGQGVYYFSNPVTVTGRIKGAIIEGVNFSVDTNGTIFNYTGTGTFLNLPDGLHTAFFKNIAIHCNYKSYGMSIDYTCTRSGLINVSIYNALGGLYLNACAYALFENVAIYARGSTSLGTIAEYGLKIGAVAGETLEHTYFNRCTIDGGTAFESYADLVIINRGGGLHFFECDFCNTINNTTGIGDTNGRAFNITSAIEKVTDIYVTNCNFSRCSGGNYFHAQNGTLQNIVFENNRFSFRGTSSLEQGFYAKRTGSVTVNLIVQGLNVATSGGAVAPEYILYAEDNALDSESVFELRRCEYKTVGQGKLRAGNNTSRVRVYDGRIRSAMRVSYTGDGTTTVYTITLSNQSPYTVLPFVAVGSNLAQTYKYAVSNTNGGTLSLVVTFAVAPPNGTTFFIYYSIIGGTLEGSGIF